MRGLTTLAAAGLGVSVAPLDTAVNVAFPLIRSTLGLEVADIRLVIAAYVLTYGSLLLVFGRVADVLGHRRVFIAGLLWSLGALGLCALASSFDTLIVARALQGVGAALVLASAPAIATHSLPTGERTRAVSGYMLAFSLATAVGPLAGGMLIAAFGWPAVFWFRLPIAIVALVLTVAFVPANAGSGQRIDWVATPLLALGLAAVLAAATQLGHDDWPAATSVTLIVTGGIAVAIAIARQRLAETRLIDLSLLGERAFASVNLAHLLVNGASFMVMLLVPFHLANTYGGAGTLSGLVFALSPLGFVLASPIAGRWVGHHGAIAVGCAGLLVNAIGLFAVALWRDDTSTSLLATSLVLHGFGYGLFQVASLDYVMARIARERHGVAGGLNMLTRTVGVVVGITLGSAAFATLGGQETAFRSAFQSVFIAAGVIAMLSTALMLLARR